MEKWEQVQIDELLGRAIEMLKKIGLPLSDSINPHVKIVPIFDFGRHLDRERGDYDVEDDFSFVHLINISLSMPYLSERAVMNTLLHELIHTCPNCRHIVKGNRFMEYAQRVNDAYGYRISENGNKDMSKHDKRVYRHLFWKFFIPTFRYSIIETYQILKASNFHLCRKKK